MERNPRPTVTRRRLICGAILSLALLAPGCGGHSNVQLSSSGSPSTGVSTGGSVHVQGRSTFGALLAIGILAGASYGSDRQDDVYGARYTPSPFSPMPPSVRVPELDASRTVHEQDCSKPIENRTANLKCR